MKNKTIEILARDAVRQLGRGRICEGWRVQITVHRHTGELVVAEHYGGNSWARYHDDDLVTLGFIGPLHTSHCYTVTEMAHEMEYLLRDGINWELSGRYIDHLRNLLD